MTPSTKPTIHILKTGREIYCGVTASKRNPAYGDQWWVMKRDPLLCPECLRLACAAEGVKAP
jgi:hypothetical protein